MSRHDEINSAITDAKVSFATALKAMERLFSERHQEIATAHAKKVAEHVEKHRALERALDQAQAVVAEAEARASRADARAAAIEATLAKERSEIAAKAAERTQGELNLRASFGAREVELRQQIEALTREITVLRSGAGRPLSDSAPGAVG